MKFDIKEIAEACKFAEIEEIKILEVIARLPKKRTNQQNRALHLFCKIIADKLNEQGQSYNIAVFYDKIFEVPFTLNIVKDQIWKPIQLALYDDESTTTLTTEKINQIVNVINKFMAEKYEIYVDWPSFENQNYG